MHKFKRMSLSRSRSRSADSKENRKIIKSLSRLDDDPSRVIDSQETYEIIFELYGLAKLDCLTNNEEIVDYFLTNKHIVKQFASIFAYLAKLSGDFEYEKSEIKLKAPNLKANLNERRISILYYMVVILDNLSNMQTRNDSLYELNKQFMLQNGLESLTLIFKQDKFFESKTVKKRDMQELMTAILRILRNLSEIDDETVLKQWSHLKVLDTLKSFNEKTRYSETITLIINDIEQNLKQNRLDEAMSFLNQFRELPTKLIDDVQCYENLLYIQRLVYRKSFKRWNVFIQHKFDEFFANVLQFYSKIHTELNFNNVDIYYWYLEVPAKSLSVNDRRVSIFHYILRIIDLLLFRSIEFLLSFSKQPNGLRAFIALCSADKLTKKLSYENQYVLETIMFSMSFLTRYPYENAEVWQECSPALIQHLIKLTKVREARDDIFLLAAIYSIIANLAKNDQIRQLPDLTYVTKFLLSDVIVIGDEFHYNEKILKDTVQFYNDDNYGGNSGGEKRIEQHEVSIDRSSLAPVTGKLATLTKLCVNDNVRVIICQRVNALKCILYRGNEIERLYVLRLLNKVCKVEKCAQFLLNDRQLVAFLKHLEHQPNTRPEAKSICHQLVDFAENYVYPGTALNREHFNSSSIGSWSATPPPGNQSTRSSRKSNNTYRQRNNSSSSVDNRKQHQHQHQPAASSSVAGSHRPQQQPTNQTATKRMSRDPYKYEAEGWNEKQVENWFNSIDVNPGIRDAFEPCDGQILKQIYKMRPEFFYQTFNAETKNKISLREVALFYHHLEKLFNPALHNYKGKIAGAGSDENFFK